MIRLKYNLYLLAAIILIAGGCATHRLDSAMIHYRPKNYMTQRPEEVLLKEIRDLLSYEVQEDDFLSSYSIDGHTCWIILNHSESAPIVAKRIKHAEGYQYLSIGKFDPQYRAIFGFKPKKEPAGNEE